MTGQSFGNVPVNERYENTFGMYSQAGYGGIVITRSLCAKLSRSNPTLAVEFVNASAYIFRRGQLGYNYYFGYLQLTA